MASVWIYQDDKQVKKRGPDAASWYVGWIDPEGKRRCQSCGPGTEGKRNAEKVRKRVEAELLTGTYQSGVKKTWEEFRKEYEVRVLAGLAIKTQTACQATIISPHRVASPENVTMPVIDFRGPLTGVQTRISVLRCRIFPRC